MKEFIKSIFETPVNLWTIGQELFVWFVCIVAFLLIIGIIWLAIVIHDKIKYRKCSLSHHIVKHDCNMDCENCKWSKKNRKKKEINNET